MINIGGTADARNVLPKIGFQARAEVRHYTRVLHPWRHFRTADRKTGSRRCAWRGIIGSWGAPHAMPTGALTARCVSNFDHAPAGAFPDPAITGQVVCARTPESLGYFLACPAAKIEAYLLERAQAPVGYFLLSRVGRQCRIADLWIRAADRQAWVEAYTTATAAASTDARTTEVTVAASAPLQTGAVEDAGYRQTHAEPVFVLDPDGRLGPHDFALSLLENDGFYWSADGA